MPKPLISFVIPCYHSSGTIQKAIDSIISQFENPSLYEILLVMENNNDDTCLGLVDERNKGIAISVINSYDKGVSANRNEGLRKAQGDYVYFLDSDDALFQNEENIFLKLINNYPGYDVFFGQSINFNDKDTRAICKHKQSLNKIEELDAFYGDFGIVNYSYYSYLFKRSFLLNNKCFIPNELINSEDYYFVGLFLTKRPKMLLTTSYFCVYNSLPNSLAKKHDLASLISAVKSFTMLINILENNCFFASAFRMRYIFSQSRLDNGYSLCKRDKKLFINVLRDYDVKNNIIKKTKELKKRWLYLLLGYRLTWSIISVARKIKRFK